MTNAEICKDYTEETMFRGGKQVKICSYWDFDIPGLCKHKDHNVCLIYLNRKKVFDPLYLELIDELSLTFVDSSPEFNRSIKK